MATRKHARIFVPLILVVGGWFCLSAVAGSGMGGEKGKGEKPVTVEEYMRAQIAACNALLEAKGKEFRIGYMEYYTAQREAGQIIYANDRTLRMGLDWVPNDLRRGGGTQLSWLSDVGDGTASNLSLADTQDAVARAMGTWNSQTCAKIPLMQLEDSGDWGVVQAWYGYGGSEDESWPADITQAGWLPGAFFDDLTPEGDGSSYILGVTFTFVWVTGEDIPTDIDGNGMADIAFSETYYNNAFPWGIGTDWPIDVESVVLHETGHSLGLDHFGRLFSTDANGNLHFAPLAVMNAAYTSVQQELTGTDLAAFCSLWANWPVQ